jgi:hypothetical protein
MQLGRLRSLLAVAGLGLTLTLLLTFPVASEFASGGRVDSGDGQFAIWNVAWVARTLVVDPTELYHANIYYPESNALAFSEANLGAGVLGIVPYWITRNPYATYNAVLLFAFTASFTATFYLLWYLTASVQAAVMGAIGFAFCPYIFARIPHIQLQLTAGLPLTLLAFHRLIERQTYGRALQLGMAIAAQALACAYYGIFAGLTVGLGVLFYAVSRGLWRSGRYWTTVAIAASVAVAIVLPFFLPYLEVQETGFARSLRDAREYPADWRAYMASSAWAHRWMLTWLVRWREVLFPGFITGALGLVGLWLGPQPGAVKPAGRDTPLFYGLLGFLAVWASFGPDGGLYTLFYYTIPIFAFLRAPARFGVLVTVALVVLSGIALERLLRGRSGVVQGAIGVAVGVVMVLELTAVPIRWREALVVPRAHQVLATLPRGPVVELPFYPRRPDFHRHSRYMLLSTTHWQPLINGYSDHIPAFFRTIALPVSGFPSIEAFHILARDLGPERARYAVFHLKLYDRRSRERLLARLHEFRSFLRPLIQEEDVWLFEIVGWPG